MGSGSGYLTACMAHMVKIQLLCGTGLPIKEYSGQYKIMFSSVILIVLLHSLVGTVLHIQPII